MSRRDRALADDRLTVRNGRLFWTPGPHNASTYANRYCRCDECKAAWAAQAYDARLRRVARLAADGSVPHGVATTYGNWGCRCRACTDAWSAESAARKRRRRARQNGASA